MHSGMYSTAGASVPRFLRPMLAHARSRNSNAHAHTKLGMSMAKICAHAHAQRARVHAHEILPCAGARAQKIGVLSWPRPISRRIMSAQCSTILIVRNI